MAPAASAMSAPEIPTELSDAAAGAAAILVDVTGATGVAAAVEPAIIEKAVVSAVNDLQQRELPATSWDEVVATLQVAVACPAERHCVQCRLSLPATESRGNNAGECSTEPTQRAAP
jgi:hypothetical protein